MRGLLVFFNRFRWFALDNAFLFRRRDELGLAGMLEMLDSVCIKRGFRQTDFTYEGVGLLVEMVDFGGAVDAEVVLAEEDE